MQISNKNTGRQQFITPTCSFFMRQLVAAEPLIFLLIFVHLCKPIKYKQLEAGAFGCIEKQLFGSIEIKEAVLNAVMR